MASIPLALPPTWFSMRCFIACGDMAVPTAWPASAWRFMQLSPAPMLLSLVFTKKGACGSLSLDA